MAVEIEEIGQSENEKENEQTNTPKASKPENGPEVIPIFGDYADETTELVVLHPEHPLMQRFQNALTKMLQEHISKSAIDLREKSEELKRQKNLHLQLGSSLYNEQQELSKFQSQLQKKNLENIEKQALRESIEQNLNDLRKSYKTVMTEYELEYKKMATMREEVDNLCLRLYYLNNAKNEVKTDITIMRRAAEKAVDDLSKIEQEKQQQDMLANRLQMTVDQLTEDCELLDCQFLAQESDLKGGENLLHEMEEQIMGIKSDRKRLMAHWTTSLIGLQRRNEAYAALMNDCNKKKDELTVANSKISGGKLAISAEREKHERLTIIVHRTENDISIMKKQYSKLQANHERLRQQYSECSRMIHEIERNLTEANDEKVVHESKVNSLRKQMEAEFQKTHDLEDSIEEELRSRLTAKKAAEYVKKMSTNMHDQSRELESQATMLENSLVADLLSIAKIRAETTRNQDLLKELEEDIAQRNDLVNKMETEIHHSNVLVQRKQNTIDYLNKKLEQMIKERGGVELGPLEITLNHLTKSIAANQEELGLLEQQWLKEQTDLVKHVAEKEKLCENVSYQQCQLTILNKKKLRLDGEISLLEREKSQLTRDMNHLQNSMTRINNLIFMKKSNGTAMEMENKLLEEDFVRALREKEQEAVELETKLNNIMTEKEDLLGELLETERHIMLWEKKVQLVVETKEAVDSTTGQGEIKAMKMEIHRMEIRKAQIARQQELLIQALEKSVSRRDTIINRNESLKMCTSKRSTKDVLLRQMDEIRKKIAATEKTISDYTAETEKLELDATRFEKDLQEKYESCDAARIRSGELTKRLQKLAEQRQNNLIELQMRQHATRYWEQLIAGRYRRLCPTSHAARSEKERQLGRMRSMLAVVDRLTSEFPVLQQDLSPVWHILSQKLEAEETQT